MDAIIRRKRLPGRGETVLATKAVIALGGKGANQAVAAARAGAHVSPGVRTVACATGTAYVTVSATGENQIAVVAAANRELRPADVEAARGAAVLCQRESLDEVVATAATVASRFFLNASPVRRLPQTVRARTELTVTAVLAGTPIERALADACAARAAVVGALGAQREGPA